MAPPEIRYRLPDALRDRLREPMAPVVDESGLMEMDLAGRLGRPLVCVGDMVCDTLLRLELEPLVMVYDLATQRGPVPDTVRERLTGRRDRLVHVSNPAASITRELDEAVRAALRRKRSTRIQVEGEEDLAGLPVIQHAPTGATMIYGMPNRGLVPVPVTPEMRDRVRGLLSLMKVDPDAGSTEGG